MVCSAQYYLIIIFKQQIRGEGRTFHRGEGEGVLRHFLTHATNQALFVRNNRLATESNLFFLRVCKADKSVRNISLARS